MFTEIIKIIEGGLERNKEKIISYAYLMAENLKKEGELRLSTRIINLLEKSKTNFAYLDDLKAFPVDNESRMNLINVQYPDVELNELVLPELVENKIDDFIITVKNRSKLSSYGIETTPSLLLYGPPGCGKTSIAKYISIKLNLPLITARLDSLISSLLGSTAKNIRKIFDFANTKPCILFLDEFDAIAKARDDQHEIGELKRVINSLITNIDEFIPSNILIAASNHHELLDRAVWRRFSSIIEISKPDILNIRRLLNLYLKTTKTNFNSDYKKMNLIYKLLDNLSPADIKNIINSTISKMIINNEKEITYDKLLFEIYTFRNHNITSEKELVTYLVKNKVKQKDIKQLLNISIRQVRNLINTKT